MSRSSVPRSAGVGPLVERAILERYGESNILPHGAMTSLGREFGVSHERIRQIASRMGRRGTPHAPRRSCTQCARPLSWSNRGTLCRRCSSVPIPVVCDGCGVTFERSRSQVLRAASDPRYQRVFCSKLCPGQPAGFAATLTEEWRRAPDDEWKFDHQVRLYWYKRGRQVQRQSREDGAYYRLKSSGEQAS